MISCSKNYLTCILLSCLCYLAHNIWLLVSYPYLVVIALICYNCFDLNYLAIKYYLHKMWKVYRDLRKKPNLLNINDLLIYRFI